MKLSLSRLMYNIYLAASVKLVICLGRSTSEFKSVSHDSFQIFLCFFPFFRSLSFCNIYSFFQFHFEWIGLCGFRFVAKVFEFRIGSQWLYGSRFCEYRLITHKISKLIAKKNKQQNSIEPVILETFFFSFLFFWKKKIVSVFALNHTHIIWYFERKHAIPSEFDVKMLKRAIWMRLWCALNISFVAWEWLADGEHEMSK